MKLIRRVSIEQGILLIVLIVTVIWRYKVGLTRFFDVDEFTHLHWAAAYARGAKPYIDFFTFFTPGYYWFLTPLFWLFGGSTALFLAARYVSVFIFLGILAAVGTLFGILRSSKYALLPMVILAFLPMPFDKFLEVRPDNLATLLGLCAVVAQVYALTHEGHKHVKKIWFVAGFLYASSLVVLVKMLPFVVVGMGIAILDIGLISQCWLFLRKRPAKRIIVPRSFWLFILGFAIPCGIVWLWALTLGDLSTVVYSLTKMPFETNTIGKLFIMEPHLFFFPNGAFYGGWGITSALLLNHTIWTMGLVVGSYRFFTPYIAGAGDKKKVLSEMLVAAIFILSVVGYVNFFPLKHSQYLIPIAIFVAWYAADGMVWMLTRIRRDFGVIPVCLLLGALGYMLWTQTVAVNVQKLTLSNTAQLEQMTLLKAMIPTNAEVFDLEGRMIYWADPYYICCLPMGTFVRFMSRPPAAIATVLEEKQVPYIFQGTSGRLWELSGDDQGYINAHYDKVEGWGDMLWRRGE